MSISSMQLIMQSFIWSCLLLSVAAVEYPFAYKGSDKPVSCSFGQRVDYSIIDRTTELMPVNTTDHVVLEKGSRHVKRRGDCRGHFKGWEHERLRFGVDRAANRRDGSFSKAYTGTCNGEPISLVVKCQDNCHGKQYDGLWEIWRDSESDHCSSHQVTVYRDGSSCTCYMIYGWGHSSIANPFWSDERDIGDDEFYNHPTNVNDIRWANY